MVTSFEIIPEKNKAKLKVPQSGVWNLQSFKIPWIMKFTSAKLKLIITVYNSL